MAIVASGPSLLLAKFHDGRDTPAELQWMNSTMGHHNVIRQVAPSLTSGRDILSGGFDQTINLWTIGEGTISNPTVSIPIPCDQIMSSVRWHPDSTFFFFFFPFSTFESLKILDPTLFSWSTEEGAMVQYDTRIGAICWQFSVFIQHVKILFQYIFKKQKQLNIGVGIGANGSIVFS